MVLARPDETEDMSIPLQFASLYDGQEIFVWFNCLLNLDTGFIVGNVVSYYGINVLSTTQNHLRTSEKG